MARLGVSSLFLVIIAGVHCASIPKETPKQQLPTININNSSIIINYFGSSASETEGNLQKRQINEYRRNLRTLLKTYKVVLEKLAKLKNGTRDVQQMETLSNITKVEMQKISATLKEPNVPKRAPAPRNLAILYLPRYFRVMPPYKVQGMYRNTWKYVFVNDSKLSSSPTYLEVKKLLDSVFIEADRIDAVQQIFGYHKNGKQVVRVTSIDGTIPSNGLKLNYCDVDGNRYEGSELRETSSENFSGRDKGHLIIKDGDCRTILFISSR